MHVGYEQDRYAKAVGERRIFRDIINEAYDPFELSKSREHSVHYSTKNLIDPVKHDLEKVRQHFILDSMTSFGTLAIVTFFNIIAVNIYIFLKTLCMLPMIVHFLPPCEG